MPHIPKIKPELHFVIPYKSTTDYKNTQSKCRRPAMEKYHVRNANKSSTIGGWLNKRYSTLMGARCFQLVDRPINVYPQIWFTNPSVACDYPSDSREPIPKSKTLPFAYQPHNTPQKTIFKVAFASSCFLGINIDNGVKKGLRWDYLWYPPRTSGTLNSLISGQTFLASSPLIFLLDTPLSLASYPTAIIPPPNKTVSLENISISNQIITFTLR